MGLNKPWCEQCKSYQQTPDPDIGWCNHTNPINPPVINTIWSDKGRCVAAWYHCNSFSRKEINMPTPKKAPTTGREETPPKSTNKPSGGFEKPKGGGSPHPVNSFQDKGKK
jgi:hypothetical protein